MNVQYSILHYAVSLLIFFQWFQRWGDTYFQWYREGCHDSKKVGNHCSNRMIKAHINQLRQNDVWRVTFPVSKYKPKSKSGISLPVSRQPEENIILMFVKSWTGDWPESDRKVNYWRDQRLAGETGEWSERDSESWSERPEVGWRQTIHPHPSFVMVEITAASRWNIVLLGVINLKTEFHIDISKYKVEPFPYAYWCQA